MSSSHTSQSNGSSRHLVQSIERAVALLSVLAVQNGGLTLTEMSERTGLHSSTAYRILATLAAHGYVRQDPHTKAYRLGFELLHLGQAARAQIDLRDEAMAYLQALASQTQELANLVIPSGFRATIIGQSFGRREGGIRMFAQLGAGVHLHCTALGKCILAYLPESELERYFEEVELIAHTPQTITNVAQLQEELEGVRCRGYAVDDEENQIGVRCVASPIHDVTGHVIGALGISGPSGRVTVERFPEFGGLVSEAARQTSRHLGYDCDEPARLNYADERSL